MIPSLAKNILLKVETCGELDVIFRLILSGFDSFRQRNRTNVLTMALNVVLMALSGPRASLGGACTTMPTAALAA